MVKDEIRLLGSHFGFTTTLLLPGFSISKDLRVDLGIATLLVDVSAEVDVSWNATK